VATALALGEPPGKTQSYPAIGPLGDVPVPAKFTGWPAPIVTFAEGLVIVPVGGVPGLVMSCTNFAIEGTPLEFRMNRR
jgi:hypothetical protein